MSLPTWYQTGNGQGNQALVAVVRALAEAKGITPAQLALAWVLAQRPWLVPIPGTTKPHRLAENLGAATVVLAPDDLRQIADATAAVAVQGARYSEASQRWIDR